MSPQTFDIEWSGGTVHPALVLSLLRGYLRPLGGDVSVVERPEDGLSKLLQEGIMHVEEAERLGLLDAWDWLKRAKAATK